MPIDHVMLHTRICESLNNLSYSTPLLTNGDVYAIQLLLYKVRRNKVKNALFKCVINLLSSSPSLNLFWLMIVSIAMAVFLQGQQ